MASAMELKTFSKDDVLARQGDPAECLYVLQRGAFSAKLVKDKDDDEAIKREEAVETWDGVGEIVGTSSVLCGHRIETLVAAEDADVLVVPIKGAELINRFKQSPKIALGFGRMLARKVKSANASLTSTQSGIARLEQDLSRIYTNFYDIITTISKDAEGDDLVLDALKDAKGCKTYRTGQGLAGDQEDDAVKMTRVIESYEMTGKQHKVKKGEALCRTGDPGNSVFIVMKGKLAVVIDGSKVGEIQTGETVGEIAVLLGENQTRTADLVAEENTVVGIIPGDQFEKLTAVQPAMLIQILNALIKRVERNYATLADHEAQEKKSVTRFLGKKGVDLEGDYKSLEDKIGELIEEYDLPLYREVDLLERGVEKITTLKEKYAEWLEALAADE